jgi:PAS domain S-box-containing protein
MGGTADKTILLVEGEREIVQSTKSSLERSGYIVAHAATGAEAALAARRLPALDLALVDVDLGKGVDGTEVALSILSSRDLPIIFLSSGTEPDLVERTARVPSCGLVTKGSGDAILDAAIKAALRRFEAGSGEALFRSFFDNIRSLNTLYEVVASPDGKPADYRFIAVNPAFERFVGMPASSILGHSLLELFPRTEPHWLAKLEETCLTGRPSSIEAYSVELDHYLDLQVFAPRKGRLAMVSYDVTAQRKAELALRESEEKFRSLVENIYDIVFTIDLEGKVTYASPAWTAILGHGVDQVAGRPYRGFVHPDDLAAFDAWLAEVRDEKRRVSGIEYRVRHLDGRWRWHSSTALPRLDGSGAVVGFQVIARDICEKKEMEERLARKSEELDRYFDSALDLLCIADTDGRFHRLNPEWENVLGYPLSVLEGARFLDFVHPDDLQATVAAVSDLDAQKEVLSFVNRYRRRDGSWRWIEWRSRPMGKMIYSVARDITDRKQAEERIERLLDEKELILREVHHRLKNSIGIVAAFLALQAGSVLDEACRGIILEAESRVQSIVMIYDRLYRSVEYQSVSMAEYLNALIDHIARNFAGTADVRFERVVEDFRMDPKRMQYLGIIATELLTNAMKYAFRGRGEGRVRVEAGCRDGKGFLVVRDDGVGIPPGSGGDGPAGFGFTLIKQLAAQLEGDARFESDSGLRATVEFPC